MKFPVCPPVRFRAYKYKSCLRNCHISLIGYLASLLQTSPVITMKSSIAIFACLAVVATVAAFPQGGRIVGGNTVTRGQVPYQVSLRTKMDQHFCGGAILSQQWVLTSGHCVTGRKEGEFIAVAGSTSLREGNGHVVTKIFLHPEFNGDGLENDIAVLQIATSFVFNLIVQPANIGTDFVGAELPATLSGWGQTSYPGSLSDDLQGIDMSTITNEECTSAHADSDGAPVIKDSNICAVSENDTGACMGDSGSPLVGENRQIIGLVSWGVPCAKNLPDVFTRVSEYRDWVIETVVSNS